jgi:ribonuclease HI
VTTACSTTEGNGAYSISNKKYIHTYVRTYINTYIHTYIHTYTIEEIRKKAIALEKRNWIIVFTWIKAHAGNYGKEMAEKLAKEAARNDDISFRGKEKNL